MIRFIYFDLGDVCYTYPHAFLGLSQKFGHTEADYQRIFVEHGKFMSKGQVTIAELWQIMRRGLKIEGGEDFDLSAYWLDQYIPRKEMHRFVEKIAATHRIGLLTNNFHGLRETLFARGLIPNAKYEVIIFSNETGMRKPEPEIYKLAQKKAGVSAGEILLVDDKENFIEGALKAGWQTQQFDKENPRKSIEEIKKLINTQ